MLQLIDSADCDKCGDKCCRFAYHLVRFAPFFSEEEFLTAVTKGHSKRLFIKLKEGGYRARLSKKEKGFFICPFLANDMCSIQKIKPYDCKIWPFILMRGKGKAKDKIYLMVDKANECHGMKKVPKEKLKKYIKYLKNYLESGKIITHLKKNKSMISNYDCDLTRVCYMKDLTKKMNPRRGV